VIRRALTAVPPILVVVVVAAVAAVIIITTPGAIPAASMDTRAEHATIRAVAKHVMCAEIQAILQETALLKEREAPSQVPKSATTVARQVISAEIVPYLVRSQLVTTVMRLGT